MLRLPAVLAVMMMVTGTHVAGAADAMPKLDIAKACKGNLPDAVGMHRTEAACVGDEERSRNELAAEWHKFSRAGKANCMREIGLGSAPSYIELQTCLEMTLWAERK
jgi:hypothetical protein